MEINVSNSFLSDTLNEKCSCLFHTDMNIKPNHIHLRLSIFDNVFNLWIQICLHTRTKSYIFFICGSKKKTIIKFI